MQRDKKNTYKYGEYKRAVQENNSKNAINIPLRICEKKYCTVHQCNKTVLDLKLRTCEYFPDIVSSEVYK